MFLLMLVCDDIDGSAHDVDEQQVVLDDSAVSGRLSSIIQKFPTGYPS
jgi:hypothetical protein